MVGVDMEEKQESVEEKRGDGGEQLAQGGEQGEQRGEGEHSLEGDFQFLPNDFTLPSSDKVNMTTTMTMTYIITIMSMAGE